MTGIHRYFPEWADRPDGPDPQHESDRNSYLAGGYADEFGYDTSLSWPPAIAPLDGDPEGGRLWREQIGALHPGYPECAKPVDRYRRDVSDGPSAGRALRIELPRVARAGIRAIEVRPRSRNPLSHAVLRLGVVAFIAERLIRSRRLNEVH